MSSPDNRAIRAIMRQLRARGWTGDQGGCALDLSTVILDDPSILDRPHDLSSYVPRAFTTAHSVSAIQVVAVIEEIRGELSSLALERRKVARLPLIQIDQ